MNFISNLNSPLIEQLFEQEIREKHSYQTFQKSDKVKQAIALITDKNIWDEVGMLMNCSSTFVKQELDLIVERRNDIAHEADIDPTYGLKRNISPSLANNSIDFLEALAQHIFDTVS